MQGEVNYHQSTEDIASNIMANKGNCIKTKRKVLHIHKELEQGADH